MADDPAALATAASRGHEGFVRLMLRSKPDVAARVGLAGKTREITELLFAHGMSANHSNWLHLTPLHRFAAIGDLENAEIFVDRGADLDARDEEFRATPLAYAANAGQAAMVEFLVRRGANARLPDDPPWATPLAVASRRGHDRIVEFLRTMSD